MEVKRIFKFPSSFGELQRDVTSSVVCDMCVFAMALDVLLILPSKPDRVQNSIDYRNLKHDWKLLTSCIQNYILHTESIFKLIVWFLR